ncbi:thymidylate synthase [Bacillus phage vB_BanS_Chewbecca]|uniref:thymidylate synthase n=1 Tax=Bacillus phage vB_BanS_Chewbecca TaxID=2894786 RepID=A0AAE8YRC7_9CAUD|nr:thymidylate synthase [Bacillus phage vB_BanS_Chewbecca]UGO46243.1 thymidylate synthase [Bacillus phage vB_BanS_Chewbecca]
MNKADLIYKQNLRRILEQGSYDENPRPRYESDGAPAYSKFITQVFEEYDISKGETPITSLRPIAIKKAIDEICWIYQDQTSDLAVLEEKYGIYWWRAWGLSDGTIGQRYGATVSKYDLLNNFLEGIRKDPFGRRHILSLWQVIDLLSTEGLSPCAFQFIGSCRRVNEDMYFDLTLIQRSSDYAVAGHINMMQYLALQMMIAHHLGMKVGKFARFTQNLHIYDRHIEQVEEMLRREPSEQQPQLILNAEGKSFYEITSDDFELINYNPVRPQLKFELGI